MNVGGNVSGGEDGPSGSSKAIGRVRRINRSDYEVVENQSASNNNKGPVSSVSSSSWNKSGHHVEAEGIPMLSIDDVALRSPEGSAKDLRYSDNVDDSERERAMGGSSTILYAVLNFVNSIVGAGIIGKRFDKCAFTQGLPYAISESGFWTGIFMICGLAWVVGIHIAWRLFDRRLDCRSLDLVEYCFGRKGLIAISIFQFLFAFGAMCAYTVIVGDTIPVVFREYLGPDISPVAHFLTSRRFVILITTICIMLPLSLYRDITKLAKTSALALFALLFILAAVIIEGPKEPAALRNTPNLDFIYGGFLQATGVISFAFVCHHNSFLIYGSLRRPTLDRWEVVTHWSTGLSCILSLTMAVPGYLIFGDKTQANILNNFSSDNWVMNLARLSFAVNMFTTFPLECFVIENYFFPREHISNRLNIILTVGLTAISTTIALSTCDLGLVLELTGCFSATALAYILPAACYMKLASGTIFDRKKLGPLLCMCLGVFVMILSTTLAITSSFTEHNEKYCNW